MKWRPMLARLLVLCALVVIGRSTSFAQSAPAENAALARELFRQGAAAAKAGDWTTARKAFDESYALYPSPRTLFNLGLARRSLGELVAARESLRAFLREADVRREAKTREIAQRELAEIEPRIAHLRIEASGLAGADELRLDERPLPHVALEAELPVDPGPHALLVVRAGAEVARLDFVLEAGETRQERIVVPKAEPLPAPIPSVALPSEEAAHGSWSARISPAHGEQGDLLEKRKRRRRRLLGGIFGALAAGAGATAAILLTRDDDAPKPVEGNVGTGLLVFE